MEFLCYNTINTSAVDLFMEFVYAPRGSLECLPPPPPLPMARAKILLSRWHVGVRAIGSEYYQKFSKNPACEHFFAGASC